MKLTTELQELLWGDRDEPFYAAHPKKERQLPLTKPKALQALQRESCRYFGPVPRIQQGNTKADCAPSFNALWCDLDIKPGIDAEEALDRIATNLDGLEFYPSAVVYSGNRGVHAYWKLEDDLDSNLVVAYNKRLARLLDGDLACTDLPRLLRHPGTRHEQTKRRAELISFTAQVWRLSDLDRLGPVEPKPHRTTNARTSGTGSCDEDWFEAQAGLADWKEHEIDYQFLPGTFHRYMLDLPARGWKRYGYASRSDIEQAIIYRLILRGASDVQIFELGDDAFARHRDELAAGSGDGYIERSIVSARRHAYEKGWITSPKGGWPRKRDADYRHRQPIDFDVAVYLAEGGPALKDWIAELVSLGWSRATAYRFKTDLERAGRIEIVNHHVVGADAEKAIAQDTEMQLVG